MRGNVCIAINQFGHEEILIMHSHFVSNNVVVSQESFNIQLATYSLHEHNTRDLYTLHEHDLVWTLSTDRGEPTLQKTLDQHSGSGALSAQATGPCLMHTLVRASFYVL